MKKRTKSLRNNSSLSMQSDTQQLTFLTYQEETLRLREKRRQQKQPSGQFGESDGSGQQRDFTQEQREHLKNAFRYICRLAFKESNRYITKIRSLFGEEQVVSEIEFKGRMVGLLKEAEMISGERYFKEYLLHLSREEQAIIIRYMIWFLQTKYVRYLKRTECEKGKRKNMKKELYLRFKNEIMLPYLHNHLRELGETLMKQGI